MSKKPILTLYRAASWSNANGAATERQPHLFYRAEDGDKLFDKIERKRQFIKRKRKALKKFYLKELGM
jgi:hypothetical protein